MLRNLETHKKHKVGAKTFDDEECSKINETSERPDDKFIEIQNSS